MAPMPEGVYARSGVDQSRSADAVGALVAALARISLGRPSRAALGSGHYANVLRLDDERGLALSCDGVGTKVIVAEELRRFDTVEELRLALLAFKRTYNRSWIIERHGYRTPAQVRVEQIGPVLMAA